MDSKPQLLSLEKFVKNTTASTERLASIKICRDLSLGGKKPKKVYAPNLNVIRNKEKAKENLKKAETSTFRKGNEKRNHQKHRENPSTRYVQSSGVFSEGTAEIKRSSLSYGSRLSNFSERENVASIVMPKLNRNSWNVNKAEEATIANELVICDDEDSSTDIEYEPVILPLDKNKVKFSKNFATVTDCMKLKEVKQEFTNQLDKLHINKTYKNTNDLNWIPRCSFNFKGKFTDDDNILSLIRFPDSLPGKSFIEETQVKTEDLTVDQLMEGQLGKIIVRKSGKMEVIIANTRYHLESEDSSFFSEEVVMFPGKNSTSAENTLVSLGPLEEKFTIIPDWNYLIADDKNNKT